MCDNTLGKGGGARDEVKELFGSRTYTAKGVEGSRQEVGVIVGAGAGVVGGLCGFGVLDRL